MKTKQLPSIIFFLLLAMSTYSQNSSLKLGLACYVDVPEVQRQQWLDDRFKLRISGHEPVMDDVLRMSYYDIFGFYVGNYLEFKDWSESKGIYYEDVLLHSKINFTYTMSNPAWSYMDMFGRFEGKEYSPKNGVLKTSDDVTYTDNSSFAYDATNSITLNNTIYIGYEEPFADINFDLTTVGHSVTWSFQYFNGTNWENIDNFTDNTYDFTTSGLLTFLPPNDWSTNSINNSREKYFVRIVINSASTYPSALRIYGDDWLNGEGDACRGWDPTDGNIINSGRLLYNPDPPAGANAKFPYQARIPFWWGNRFIANPADIQSIGGQDRYTWAMYSAYVMINAGDYDGIMCDDAEGNPTVDPSNTDFADKTDGRSWTEYSIYKYTLIRQYVKEEKPDFLMGMNGSNSEMLFLGDFSIDEFFTVVHNTGAMNNVGDNTFCAPWKTPYDAFRPDNNPNGTFVMMMYYDYADEISNDNIPESNPYLWDRANRGPIAALSLHYIAQNENTYFNYHGQLGYVYGETDEVFLKDGSTIYQGLEPAPNCDEVYRWARYFPAMAIDVGVPDITGYNSGERNVEWKTAAEADNVLRGGNAHGQIGRRDYTNAIVVFRGADWDSNYDEFDTYSNSFDLGGTYYPLKADGTTENAITAIALRMGEGAILMKYKISSVDNQVDESNQIKITVSPNPNNGIFTATLMGFQNNAEISLYNTNGSLVYQSVAVSTKNEIDTRELPAGLYSLVCRSNSNMKSVLFVKY